ncbi:MAG: S1/P1 Nuclease [Williamsia sp.]|nr:S1/P1 Nuclease [Williamsia sp.]
MGQAKKFLLVVLLVLCYTRSFCWGFFAHEKINFYAVFLLPPRMLAFYKPHIQFLSEHAVDPDKRRYLLPQEGARHYIDIDRYGSYPYTALPRKWEEAVARYGEDTLQANGIVPWWIPGMLQRLTRAFSEKNSNNILKLSAELGHYVADAHVPLHACHNHNGQYTDQKGIHAFWESRIPELLADKEWNFFIHKATYISRPAEFIWDRVLESAAAADTVLEVEKKLSSQFPPDQKWAFETRKGALVRQYSTAYTMAYNQRLGNMVERRMRQAIYAVASLWYTAWVNAGQPDLGSLNDSPFSPAELQEFEQLNKVWREGMSEP